MVLAHGQVRQYFVMFIDSEVRNKCKKVSKFRKDSHPEARGQVKEYGG